MRRWAIRWFVCVVAAVLGGCGGAGDANVSGTVFFDRQPLGRGTVSFHPVGPGAVAYGQIDAAGKFRLKTGSEYGVKPGEYRVTVVATEEPAQINRLEEVPPKRITPEKYARPETSGLTETVTSGAQSVTINLSSSP